jgi:flavin-dependent dehydrogenase
VSLPRSVDALVVGLGPAGAATALRLARAGVRVLAIDRFRFPRDKPCSEYMSPETLRQFDRLGLWPAIEPLGVPLAGATVVGPRGSRLTGLFARAGVAPFSPTGLSVPRHRLDGVLVDAARRAGVLVVEEAHLVALTYERGAASGALIRREGRLAEVRARIVIGADGLRSVVARLLGHRRHGSPRRYAFVAHVAGVSGLGTTAELHVGDEGYVGLNAVGADVANVALVVPAAVAARASGDRTGFWHRTLDRFEGVAGRVSLDRVVRPVLASGPFAAWSSRVVADGAALVGDAADFFDPFTGEGICAALRGAALLAPVVADALRRPGIVSRVDLTPYRRARRNAFAGKWAVERMIGYGMWAPALFDRAVGRLERRGLAHTLIGVTGDFVPAREVLRPGFLAAMMI